MRGQKSMGGGRLADLTGQSKEGELARLKKREDKVGYRTRENRIVRIYA